MKTPDWYKDAILYEIDIRRFQDSDGNGVGDLRGLTERLDYVAGLGVTCLWLLPFYPSPFRDDGYDVTDHIGVDPSIGSLADFEAFMDAVRGRGLRVIVDLIGNHTSDQHPWFRASRRGPHNRYRDYYVWAEDPPEPGPDGGPIFPGEESSVWTYDEAAGASYYHRFYHFQPELKTGDPKVIAELERVIDFWLAFGVDGFRIDAAPHLAPEAHKGGDADPHPVLKELRGFADDRQPPGILLGEVDSPVDELAEYFGDGDELHMAFNFLLANKAFLALARRRAAPLVEGLKELPDPPPSGQWVNFLRNHDELDLERLTDEERAEVLDTFAPDEDMRIFDRGTRRRLAPMLADRRRVELALTLLFSLPGTPCLYYGDEIGMGENLSLHGRGSVRNPMQWSSDQNAGFSSAGADQLLTPVVAEGDFSYRKVNVASQEKDPESLLNWCRSLTRARRDCPELGRGNASPLDTGDPAAFALRCEHEGSAIYAVLNLAEEDRSVDLEVREAHAERVFGPGKLHAAGKGRRKVSLPASGYLWFRARG